jgi:hypothetical protein
MNVIGRLLLIFALSVSLGAIAHSAAAADAGLVTKPSKYSVSETLDRFEAAVKAKGNAGFKVFTRIDHAAAAKEAGLEMRPRTVIVFGNPKLGTPVMVKTPLLAIDVPPLCSRACVGGMSLRLHHERTPLGLSFLTMAKVEMAAALRRTCTSPQSFQKSRNRSGVSSVYRTVCWMFLWPR